MVISEARLLTFRKKRIDWKIAPILLFASDRTWGMYLLGQLIAEIKENFLITPLKENFLWLLQDNTIQ